MPRGVLSAIPSALRSACLSLSLATVGVPITAQGAPGDRPAAPDVLLWPSSPAVAAELPETIDPRFGRADPQAFITELEAFRTAAHDDARTRLGAVERALAAAREHYTAQRWDAMTAELEHSLAGELALLADPRHCDALWEVAFGLGLAARGRKQTDVAVAHTLFALALAPDRRPAREVYGPEVVAEFLDALDAQSLRVAVPVDLDVSPADAVVHVDCRPVHGTHVDLRPGTHVIHARAMGHTATARLFEVPEVTRVEHAATPDAAPDALARLGAGLAAGALVLELPSHRRALVEAAAARGIEIVVVVEASGDGATARVLVGAARGPKQRRTTIDGAISAALGTVADDGTLRGDAPAAPSTTPRSAAPARKPIARAWWLWTIVGVVVATGVGLGLGLGLRDRTSDRLIIYGPR